MPAGPYQLCTFTAAGNAVSASSTSWKQLTLNSGQAVISANDALGDQLIRVACTSTATGAAGELTLVLADPDQASSTSSNAGIIYRETATVTVTARRTNYANSAANNYVCDVAFTKSAREYADLFGHCTKPDVGGPYWYLGCTSLGGLSQLNVFVFPGRAI